MKIATFNINNVNRRLPNLLAWLAEAAPDVVCLQELKASDTDFPVAAIRDAGYGAVWQGQRTWNGVAILARGSDPVLTRRALPGDPTDKQSRYIEAAVEGVLIGCIYLPNGNPQPGPKFVYKLAWFDRLIAHAAELYATGLPVVLAGDYNVVPTDQDIYPIEVLDEGCVAAAGKPSGLSPTAGPGMDRRHPRPPPGRPRLHVLGLQTRSLGSGCRATHRPHPAKRVAVPASGRRRRGPSGAGRTKRQRPRPNLGAAGWAG